MKANRRLAVATLTSALALGAAASAASAADQVVTATIATSVTISSSPADIIATPLTLPAVLADLGDISVTSNTPYTLSAKVLKANMTSYDGTSYDDTTTLGAPMILTTVVKVPGTGTGLPAKTLGTADTTIATGLGLLTDTYDLTLSQATTIADAAGTYRNVITYTASAGV